MPAPDVVVIGSGPGGGSVAYGLAHAGIAVTILEAGPRYEYWNDYRLDRPDWEQSGFPNKLRRRSYTVAPTQSLDADEFELRSWDRVAGAYNTTGHRLSWGYQHVQGVGGTTLHYTGEAHRLNPHAMRLHSRFAVGADWPFDYGQLEPYYVEAERVIGAAGRSFDPVRWRSAPYPLPPHRLSYASRKVESGCHRLGLTLAPNSLGILSGAYDGRPPCNYCANCIRGCPRADKASVDVTFVAKAEATKRCTTMPMCQVVQLEAGPDDQVRRAVYIDPKGHRRTLQARAFVIAGGAVHTPRLLLASANSYASDGLANESGQVGRNFMETVMWVATGLHPQPLGSHRGVPADAICWDFNAPDAIPGAVGGCRFSIGAPQVDLMGPIAYATRVVGGFGRGHKQGMREVFGRALSVVGIAESLPNERAYVGLNTIESDEFGVPLALIQTSLGDGEIRRITFMREQARAILEASDAGEIIEEYGTYDHFASTQVFGTCRMGTDAETSVVDPSGRSHRWRNLYVVDASVFPSSGGGEAPSLTIEALGLRTAHLLRDRLRRGDL